MRGGQTTHQVVTIETQLVPVVFNHRNASSAAGVPNATSGQYLPPVNVIPFISHCGGRGCGDGGVGGVLLLLRLPGANPEIQSEHGTLPVYWFFK